jgi:hypothetical protein
MENFKIKRRHYKSVRNFVAHHSYNVSSGSMKKRANSTCFLQKNFSTRPDKPKLVGSADGKLTKIMFSIPGKIAEKAGEPIWNIFTNIFQNLPEHTKIYLVIQSKAMDFIQNWVEQNMSTTRFEFIETPQHIDITVWAEDPYAIAEDLTTGEKYFIESHSFPRWGDGFIGYFASKKLNWNRIITPFYFEGGNMLVGDDFFLIGADYPLESIGHTSKMLNIKEGESETEFLTRIYNEHLDSTRKLIYVGSTLPVPSNNTKKIEINGEEWEEIFFQNNEGGTVQPLFHIDMFITLAGRASNGKYRVLVGDSRLAAEILDMEILKYGIPELFDDVAQGLTNNGFEVIRLPLPVIYLDEPENKKRFWYFTTYNNCLVEIIDEKNKTIWLPTYGYGEWEILKKTDERAREIFEELGFKVIMLTDYHPLAEGSGSLHCIKKYLERV